MPDDCKHRECARQSVERFFTAATCITLARTLGTLILGFYAAAEHSLALLLWALGIYWVGDMLDGAVARYTNRETRIGAMLDILCDRISAAVFYVGFAWLDPTMLVPVAIYLFQFMVIDMYLSCAFLAWPISSTNYFYLVDRRLWFWNWSKVGKALNSAFFAVLMLWTREPVFLSVIACGLLALKITSTVWLMQLGLPLPDGCAHAGISRPGVRRT